MADVTLRALLIGEDRSASKALKGVGVQAEKVGKSASIAGAALKGGLAAVSFSSVSRGIRDAVEAAEEAEVSNARLEQVFRSMGDASGEAATQAESYAEKLSLQIGVDDDVIKSTQAKLATFKAVSDETARQQGIFQRATDAAADLAATGFGAMDANAVKLGRALQDPVKGLSALTRAGVTFTAQEKENIKAMVASGDQLGAQKLILAAIEKQVGGVAKATATATGKQSVAFENIQEALGRKLMPAYEELTGAVVNLTASVDDNASAFAPLFDIATGVATAFNDITRAASDTSGALGWLKSAADNISGLSALQSLSNAYTDQSKAARDAAEETRGSTGALRGNATVANRAAGAWDGVVDSVEDSVRALKLARSQLAALEKKAKELDGTNIRFSVSASMNKSADEIVYKMGASGTMKFSARAGGGPVRAGVPYIVGERGWEVMVPETNGRIVNQHQLGRGAAASGGDTIIFNVDARGAMSDLDFGAMADRGLTKLVQARRGRPPQFMQVAVQR